MSSKHIAWASLAILSVLSSSTVAQLDPVFAGLQVPVAPEASVGSFHFVVAADIDRDGLADLLSAPQAGTGPTTDHVLGVARGLPGGGYAAVETWPVASGWFPDAGPLDVGDLNHDDWPDVAVTGQHHVRVLYGTGGGFSASVPYFVSGEQLSGILLSDLDQDGWLDLLTTSFVPYPLSGTLNVNLADGHGGFFAAQAWPLPSPATCLASGDLDGDGWTDVAAVGPDAALLEILQNDGAGGFAPLQSLPTDPAPKRVLLGSLDTDGDLDVVVVARGEGLDFTSGRVRAWLNDGAGNLQAGEAVPVGRTLTDGLLHDTDADGDLDVAVVDNGSWGPLEQLLLVDNDGTGQLSAGPSRVLIAPIEHPLATDGTGDGVVDLLLTPIGTSAALLPSRPDGALALGSQCGMAAHTTHGLVADLDGDAWPDVFYSNIGDDNSGVGTLLGSADGLLPDPVPSPSLQSWVEVIGLGELTGDGVLDALVVHTGGMSGVFVGPGLGDGSFGPPFDVGFSNLNSDPRRIVPADMDQDGWFDAVLLRSGLQSRLEVFPNQGLPQPGQPLPATIYLPGYASNDMALADLDGDTLTDVAVARGVVSGGTNPTLAVFFGDGQGGLSPLVATDLPAAPQDPQSMQLADFDLDGCLDAAISLGDAAFVLARGDGAGGFVAGDLLPGIEGYTASALAVADVDGDGWPDAVQTGSGNDDILVRRGNGMGGLVDPLRHVSAGHLRDAVLADMNRDGRPDLVLVGWNEYDPVPSHVQVTENVRRTFTWTDLGHGKAGPHGEPQLTGTGTLAPYAGGALHLAQAAPAAQAALLVSVTEQPLPWKAGVLVPAAPQLLLFVITDLQGHAVVAWTSWPGGPAGTSLVVQAAIADAGASHGVALSNALRGTLPD